MTTLTDDAGSFSVTVLESPSPRRVVLFAAGRGGDPSRHHPLLEALHAAGCTVIAPHAEFLADPRPTAEYLLGRARRLQLALERWAPPGHVVHGVGHSIGGTTLLALAGARAWLGPEQPLAIAPVTALDSLTLLAPALGFFQAPGACDGVTARVSLWWGSADALCPRAQVDFTLGQLGARARLHVADGAGHFSFMHVKPPGTVEPLAEPQRFLSDLTASIVTDAVG